jgi:hypothetical protein
VLFARRTMRGERPALLGGGNRLVVNGDLARLGEHVDLVRGLAHLDRLADQLVRHRVGVAVDVDVAFEIDDPLVQHVDLGRRSGSRRIAGARR